MKHLFKFRTLLFMAASVVLISLMACEEEDLPPIVQKSTLSFTINGQGYNNQTLSYQSNILGALQMMSDTIIDGDTLGGTIIFFPKSDEASNKASVGLQITGSTPGTYNWPVQSQLIINFSHAGDSTKYVSATDSTFSSKTIVATYGNIAEKITGTFSGICVSTDTALKTINISNGQFDLVRKK
ncbi:MAG: hypothetical protein BWY70_01289 [Bacteroidetes bacterium ADurb.Bin408]|nr:MAG: hypothetical protein BWY70_01289 [Bacteroidetes bacterium ADurb.Bin408]